MKRSMLLLSLALAIINVIGQMNQTFPNEKFKIKCPCKLYTNSVFLTEMKKTEMKYPVTAYVCAENENNYQTAAVYNINIYDLSEEYSDNYLDSYTFEERFLLTYRNNIVSNQIQCYGKTFHKVKAYQYNFSQMGLPTKAIVFVWNKKAYLLQVGSRYHLEERFEYFTNSFSIN